MAKRKFGTIVQLLRAAVKRAGTQDAFAKRHGIDRSHLNQILSRKKSVNAAVVKALRLQKVYARK
jgi:DNA-binding transcriptional regulator YdaS (Cro superfamily)